MFPQAVHVTDQEIDLSGLNERQKQQFRDLADRVLQEYRLLGRNRAVVGFAGPSGVGKSVAVEILRSLLGAQSETHVYVVDIDAFHYPNNYLEATKVDDGTTLRAVKGRFDTYDTDALTASLKAFHAGNNVSMPHYSRTLHDVVPDAFTVVEKNALILLAGLWLLYDVPAWNAVRALVQRTYLLTCDEATMRERVVTRHMKGGRSQEDAERFYKDSDQANADLLAKHSVSPDSIITLC